MQFVERLAEDFGDERWLVDVDGTARVAWFVRHDADHPAWLPHAQALLPAGTLHPRLAMIHATALLEDRMMVIVDDDRGPELAVAAAALADRGERERWCVAQIIGLAEALAKIATTPIVDNGHIFVDVGGHARLRAAIMLAPRPPTTRTGTGRGYWSMPYASPEHLMARGIGPASLTFSLATNLCEAITGQHPFGGGENRMDAAVQILQAGAPRPELVTPGLGEVIARAFAKPIGGRPDLAAFAAALREALPDAGDDDIVLSDRLVPWRATFAEPANTFEDVACQERWDAPAGEVIRRCERCKVLVLRVRDRAAPVPLHGWSCPL